jgi:hypothetical protein
MKNTLLEITAILSMSAERWESMTANIPEVLLLRRPEPQEWSALECLQHLIDGENLVFPVRIKAFLNGEDIKGLNPDDQEKTPKKKPSPGRLAKKFTELRADNLKLLAKITIKDLTLTAQHNELGKVTLIEMLNEWAGHDLMHLVQAEQAIMQPFIMASGPRRKYFKDHDVNIKN